MNKLPRYKCECPADDFIKRIVDDFETGNARPLFGHDIGALRFRMSCCSEWLKVEFFESPAFVQHEGYSFRMHNLSVWSWLSELEALPEYRS
jgi:hypothetical protein